MPLVSGAAASVFLRDERHGPLPALLLVLTMVTGLVDAVSSLNLGHVFVANMTGNVSQAVGSALPWGIIAADSTVAGGTNPNPGRRLVAMTTMFVGAAIGALLIFHVGVSAVLALALALLLLSGIASYRLSSSSDAWTVGT